MVLLACTVGGFSRDKRCSLPSSLALVVPTMPTRTARCSVFSFALLSPLPSFTDQEWCVAGADDISSLPPLPSRFLYRSPLVTMGHGERPPLPQPRRHFLARPRNWHDPPQLIMACF